MDSSLGSREQNPSASTDSTKPVRNQYGNEDPWNHLRLLQEPPEEVLVVIYAKMNHTSRQYGNLVSYYSVRFHTTASTRINSFILPRCASMICIDIRASPQSRPPLME